MPRLDSLDPLHYSEEWPSLRSAFGRVDIHSLASFWVRESKIPGDYFEFGVGQGRSAVAAIRASRKHEVNMSYHLFDSFEGLPELEGVDNGSDQFHKSQFSFDKNSVLEFIEKHGIDISKDVYLHSGWFSDLNSHEINQSIMASIVHIDCDLYSSAMEALTYITPRLSNGSIILFDDFNAFRASNQHGERKALHDWLDVLKSSAPFADIVEYADYGWHGKCFIFSCPHA